MDTPRYHVWCGCFDTNTHTTISCKILLFHFQCGLYYVIKVQLFGEPLHTKKLLLQHTMPRVMRGYIYRDRCRQRRLLSACALTQPAGSQLPSSSCGAVVHARVAEPELIRLAERQDVLARSQNRANVAAWYLESHWSSIQLAQSRSRDKTWLCWLAS